MITDTIRQSISDALEALNIAVPTEIELEHPAELEHGDYASNIAFKYKEFEARALDVKVGELKTARKDLDFPQNPRELAKKITKKINNNLPKEVSKVEVAGPGFINFYLSVNFFTNQIKEIRNKGNSYGYKDIFDNQKTIFEYTTQNLMKEFHVGHLMSHVIGNAVSNIYEAEGARVKRDSYQGDVGMHIAKVVWAIWKDKDSQEPFPDSANTPQKKAKYLGMKYSFGDSMYASKDEDLAGFSEGKENNQKEIEEINKKIYKKNDPEINELYEKACQWSKESYQALYDRLGVKLDWQFFESETAPIGKDIVEEGLKKGIFEEHDGAIIYRGDESKGLHTRVFISSVGIPTYEAKDLGLMKLKHEKYPYDKAIIFTANEQNDYFKVVLAAAKEVIPKIGKKTIHIGHGILELADGKMSSRSGDVLSAIDLLNTVKEKAKVKIADRLETEVKEDTAEKVAQAAIRYAILKQDTSKNVTFNIEQALSFEGNSGPYLQYTYARCRSILKKSHQHNSSFMYKDVQINDEISDIEKWLYRFPEVVERSAKERSPHFVATFLYKVAQSFNTFYGHTQILDNENSQYRVALTSATAQVLKNGLKLLGIKAPDAM